MASFTEIGKEAGSKGKRFVKNVSIAGRNLGTAARNKYFEFKQLEDKRKEKLLASRERLLEKKRKDAAYRTRLAKVNREIDSYSPKKKSSSPKKSKSSQDNLPDIFRMRF